MVPSRFEALGFIGALRISRVRVSGVSNLTSSSVGLRRGVWFGSWLLRASCCHARSVDFMSGASSVVCMLPETAATSCEEFFVWC